MNNKYYVYQYIDPRSMLPFYIGKGCGDRLFSHLKEIYTNTENKKKYAVIENLRKNNLTPIIEKIKDQLTEAEAYNLEELLIEKYGRRDLDCNGILTNICKNNRPPDVTGISRVYSEERVNLHKKINQERCLGKKYKDIYGVDKANEIKKKVRRVGHDNGFYGKTHSLETKEIMSIKATTRLIQPRLGKKFTDESKEKIRLNNPNRKSINTPYGIFTSAEDFCRETKLITANGLRRILKNCDIIITKKNLVNNKLLSESDIGLTFREKGFYYI